MQQVIMKMKFIVTRMMYGMVWLRVSNSDVSDGDIIGPRAQGRGMTRRHGGGTGRGHSTGRGHGTGRGQDTSNDYNWTSISTGRWMQIFCVLLHVLYNFR